MHGPQPERPCGRVQPRLACHARPVAAPSEQPSGPCAPPAEHPDHATAAAALQAARASFPFLHHMEGNGLVLSGLERIY